MFQEDWKDNFPAQLRRRAGTCPTSAAFQRCLGGFESQATAEMISSLSENLGLVHFRGSQESRRETAKTFMFCILLF